ncbi:hypothetical protein A2960_06615 [Candidatus Gottesmanbacteria bacterium RIFCSPLOWO2_01_FULL_39_12b]|uniref:Uncharacterized protein n=1 Tax=Candidatus Gottesmanbacteria bacterium RIFCSPLOWO2_01_FULL_39_12b TaxID=1798388 RepID=A0A1F6ARX3_9BACT|nr:MAG: hypothetical protein A2960_06615 [Candidatus Gottesmanbacteria bacterium RIFCSPLOWO2_01_FULL_39_12b]
MPPTLELSRLAVRREASRIHLLDRRQFLKLAFLTAGASALAACAGKPQPEYAPPTPTAIPGQEYFPQPIPDTEWQSLTDEQRVINMVKGKLPESWSVLLIDELITTVISEIQSRVIPKLCEQLSPNQNCSGELLSNLIFVRSDQEMKETLMSWGISESDAEKTSQEDDGIIEVFYDPETAIFSIPQKRGVVKTNFSVDNWTEFIKRSQSLYPNNPVYQDPAYLNSLIVASVTNTAIHETVHYLAEPTHIINSADEDRIKEMYKGLKINDNGNIYQVNSLDFHYSVGAYLVYSRNQFSVTWQLNGDLAEAYRAYIQIYSLENISQAAGQPESLIYEENPSDVVAINLLRNFHQMLGIDPSMFVSVYSNPRTKFVDLLDFYQKSAKSKEFILSDQDLFYLFRFIELAKIDLDKSFDEGYKLGDEFRIIEKYSQVIANYLAEKQATPISGRDWLTELFAASDRHNQQLPPRDTERVVFSLLKRLAA